MELFFRQSLRIRIFISVAFVLLAAVFYLLKWQEPLVTERLFMGGRNEILNSLTQGKGEERLGFYLGRMEEVIWGPLGQLISGLTFTWFVLLFLQKAGGWKFGAAVFVYLLLTKWEVLAFPPYGDAVGGPFAEAIFLEQNSFNYLWLLHQDGYAMGGAKVYMFSIYPTFLAALIRLIPSPIIFLIVNHALTFALSAAIVTVLRNIFLKIYRPDLAALGALLLLFLPLFQSQTEAINMEIPSAFFMLMAADALINRRVHRAGIMTTAALCIKGTEILACWAFALITLGVLLNVLDPSDTERGQEERDGRSPISKRVWLTWSLALLALAALKVLSKFWINDQHVSEGMMRFAAGWPSLHILAIFYLYVFSALIFAVFVVRRWGRRENRKASGVWQRILQGYYIPVVMLIYGGMWFALFLNFFAVSPRYRTSLYPFLVFSVFFAVSLLVKHESVRKWALLTVIILSLVGSYGAFCKPTTENDHVILERSLEYRNDLQVNRLIVDAIENRFSRFQIVAPFIIAQSLGIPDLGYVKKKLDVMIYGYNCYYGGLKNFPGRKGVDLEHTIYIAVKIGERPPDLEYPIHAHDRIIEELQYGNKKAWLFMGGIGIDGMLRATQMLKLKELIEKRDDE